MFIFKGQLKETQIFEFVNMIADHIDLAWQYLKSIFKRQPKETQILNLCLGMWIVYWYVLLELD